MCRLKTPPATPLFASLEMEATGPQLVNINNNKNTPNSIPALQQPPLSRVYMLLYTSVDILLYIMHFGNFVKELDGQTHS